MNPLKNRDTLYRAAFDYKEGRIDAWEYLEIVDTTIDTIVTQARLQYPTFNFFYAPEIFTPPNRFKITNDNNS